MAFHFVEDANEEYEPLVVDMERIRMDLLGLLDVLIVYILLWDDVELFGVQTRPLVTRDTLVYFLYFWENFILT